MKMQISFLQRETYEVVLFSRLQSLVYLKGVGVEEKWENLKG